jgi:adenylate cyclase
MLESFWLDLADASVKGLSAGGASLAVRWIAHKAIEVLGRARARRGARSANHSLKRRPLERRLVAILTTDVAGYSRLTELDEEGTHDRLTAHRREAIEPKVREHRGRIVKNTGDGVLVEFASVVEAVRCAIELQRLMAARNAAVLENDRIEFRIGVNLGDVIIECDDIYGDSVNVTVRIEGLAEPGGICVSADAWRCVRGRVAAQVIDLGQQRLKNIAEPTYVYAIPPIGRIADESCRHAS